MNNKEVALELLKMYMEEINHKLYKDEIVKFYLYFLNEIGSDKDE